MNGPLPWNGGSPDDPIAVVLGVLLSGDGPWDMALGAFALIVSSIGFALAAVPVLGRIALPPLDRKSLVSYVLMDRLLEDRRTIRGRTGVLSACIEVAGLDVAGATSEERIQRRDRRSEMFQKLSELDVHVRVLDLHERVAAAPLRYRKSHGDEQGIALRRAVVERWEAQFETAFVNRHVVVLSVAGDDTAALDRLNKARLVVARALHEFNPSDLGERADEEGGSDLLDWWAGLISRASRPRPRGRRNLARLLAVDGVELNTQSGLLTWSHGPSSVHAYAIGLSSWGRATAEEVASRLMALDGEILMLNQAYVHSETGGIARLASHERAASSTWFDERAQGEFDAVRAMIQPNSPERERLTRHSLTVFAFGRTPEEAARVQAAVERVFQLFQAETVVFRDLAGVVWWSALPGWERWSFINEIRELCQNVSDLVTFETPSTGLQRCGWGGGHDGWILRAITSAGTPYYVNFHEGPQRDALAHVAMFGRTGSGKTTEANLMIMGALEHFPGLRAAKFDSKFGQFVATTMAGGRYVSLLANEVDDPDGLRTDGAGIRAQLQPLQRRLNTANKAHLVKMFRLLTGLEDPASERLYQYALETLVQMEASGTPTEERTLWEVVHATFPEGSPARLAMAKWLPGGTYESIFSGREHLPIGDADDIAFDFTTALTDSVLASPLVEDITHLIGEMVRAEAVGGIFGVDETSHLWRNPVFFGKGVDWLQQLRKDRIAVMTMWQRPSALMEIHPNLPQIIRSQTATWTFHRDKGADYADYKDWLTPAEFRFVDGSDKSFEHMRRPMLLKKPNNGESQVLEMSTEVLGEYGCVFSSDAKLVERAKVLQTYDPVNWREQFIDEFGGR